MDPTTLITSIIVYALTVAAKALGLPDATVPVRAFAAFMALLIPIILAWKGGTLATYDWNTGLPALLAAMQVLGNAGAAYLAAAGIHDHVKAKE